MDALAIVITVSAIYILLCILFSLFIDADSTTFLYSKFGPSVTKRLEGRVLWIVGAGRGVGSAIAISAAARGAKLVLTARNKNELEKVKTECLNAGRYQELKSEDILVLPFDISKMEDHDKHVKKVLEKMGKISGVIHCVGASHYAQWVKTSLDTDRELFDTCVFGAVSLTRAMLPHMIERNNGMIGVLSCVEAQLAAPFAGSMTGYKHVRNLSRDYTSLNTYSGIGWVLQIPET